MNRPMSSPPTAVTNSAVEMAWTSRTSQAAWVRFPELTVHKAAQTYERLDEFTYRYSSGAYEAELVVDDDGVVAHYDVWERTGVADGPDDTAPLDSR